MEGSSCFGLGKPCLPVATAVNNRAMRGIMACMVRPGLRAAFLLCVAAPGCGGVATSMESLPGGSSEAGLIDVASDTSQTYHGVVLAAVSWAATGNEFRAFTAFSRVSAFSLGGCSSDTPDAGSCCTCESGISLPGPDAFPDASTVTLSSAGGATLATLTPTYPVHDDGGVSSSYYGTMDLGPWGDGPVSTYAGVASQPWAPGDALSVTATGDQVHAFHGTLQTGALLAGLTPSFASTLTVDRSEDFVVSWVPGGGTNDNVVLRIGQMTTGSYVRCFCAVTDSVGSVTVPASVLAGFLGTTDAGSDAQLGASITLERLRVSKATSDNAVIDLVGAVEQTVDAVFE
jgi:hypothetical protein